MRKTAWLFILLLFIPAFLSAQDVPARDALEVKSVLEPYDPEVWIVSEREEPKGDNQVKDAPECDIRGITACYDGEWLRFDIILHSPVTGKLPTVYGIKLEYSEGYVEYFICRPDAGELYFITEQDGETQSSELLDEDSESGDFAELTSYGGKANAVVVIVINKDYHLGGDEGDRIYLTCSFETGKFDENDEVISADGTDIVDVYFEL